MAMARKIERTGAATVFALAGLIVNPSALRAQAGETGGGGIFRSPGLTLGRLGAHAAVGASSGMSFSRYSIALMGVSFMPLGDDTLRYHLGRTIQHSGLYDFNFSAHFQVHLS